MVSRQNIVGARELQGFAASRVGATGPSMKASIAMRLFVVPRTILNTAVVGQVVLIAAVSAMAVTAQEPRSTIRLNFDWRYRPGEIGDDFKPGVAIDDRWQTVQLPHDASVHRPFSRTESDSAGGWLPRGAGVYRKTFELPESARGKRVLVEFEGVYRDANVWINGRHLTRQLNGYLGFEVDLTEAARFGAENVLVVAYDNRTRGTSRWYTGEGIYRDVWLRIVSPLHVPLHGTYVVTPSVTPDEAIVAINTDVTNQGDATAMCRLVTDIHDAQGRVVAAADAVAPLAAEKTYTFRQEIDVHQPQLWDLDRPRLYLAISKVYHGTQLVDVYKTRFGIRTIRMTPARGLMVNGKKVVAMGGNLHHDLGCLGSAALKAGYEKHIDELKAISCNSVRLAHNPHARVLLDVCDEKGVLVFNEAYDKWTSQYYGGEKSFESQWQTDIARFIRRDRNHPSVYIWSMGNEVLKQQGRYEQKFETPEAGADFGVGLMQRMATFTRQLDPSRKVTAALFPARAHFIKEWEHWNDYDTFTKTLPAEMAFAMDVVSWNYTENMFAQDHKTYPQFMFIASETGTNLDFGNRRPSWLEMDPSYVIGHYYWSAYDYLGESSWPKKSWGRSLIDLSGWVTPIGRYYQSFYSDNPMVHIMVRETDPEIVSHFEKIDNKRWDWYPMVDHWTWPGRDTAKLTTFTNCEDVQLILNGNSLGVKKLSDGENRRIDWEIPCRPGELKAIARVEGKVVAQHVLRTAQNPVRIRLTTRTETLSADGLDLAYVEAALVDANGNLVPEKGREIRFNVDGPGVNAGVASGNVISDEPWQADTRRTWNGRCRLIIRAGRTPGVIQVRAEADGLTCTPVTLRCESPSRD